jgi:hypothetical protein
LFLAGEGPEGSAILCAARLTGQGKLNVAGIFGFDDERNVQTFTFTDQMVNVEDAYYNGQSSNIVTQTVQRVMKDVLSPTAFRLTHSAALMAACSVRSVVHITHADGVATILRFVQYKKTRGC